MKTTKIFSGVLILLFLAGSIANIEVPIDGFFGGLFEMAQQPFVTIPLLLAFATFGGSVIPGVHTADIASDTSALAAYAGTYSKQLISTMLNSLDIAKDIKVIRNLRSDHKLTKISINAGIRPTNTSVSDPTGYNRVFSERTISMKGGMKIFRMIPEDLRSTFMSDMLDPNANTIPFAEYVWTAEFEKLGDEVNESVYLADYNADAAEWASGSTYSSGDFVNFNESIYEANASTSAGESPTTHPAKWDLRNAESICTGLGTIIANEITASALTPVTTGAVSSSTAYGDFQDVWRNLDVALQKKSMNPTIYCSYDVFQKYVDNVETLFGNGNLEELPELSGGDVYLRKTARRCKIVPCTWMGSSQRIICTPKDNLVMGTNSLDDFNGIGKTVETLHGFDAICKYMLGFQIQDLAALSVNDQA